MKDFTLRRLSFGAICLAGDFNLPDRAEKMQSLDIDGQMLGLAEMAGVKLGDTVVDVGAFVGDTAYSLAQSVGQLGRVIAIEPFFDAAVCAVWNNRANPQVTVANRAAGNGEWVRLVYDAPCNERGPNLGMRSVRQALPYEEGAIQSLKIDELGLQTCSFMKIDCEGSEIPTLLGAAETIKRCRPVLFVEMFRGGQEWRGFTPELLKSTIEGLGYSLEQIGEAPRWDWLCRPL